MKRIGLHKIALLLALLSMRSLHAQPVDPNSAMAKEIKSSRDAQNVTTLFKGKTEARWSTPGYAPSDRETNLIEPGSIVTIELGSTKCTLKTIGSYNSSDEDPPTDYSMVLSCGNRTQTIWDIHRDANGFVDQPNLQLLWAGDADNDGKLDLYLNLSPKYSCGRYVEFDSSTAKRHALVGPSKRPIVEACPD